MITRFYLRTQQDIADNGGKWQDNTSDTDTDDQQGAPDAFGPVGHASAPTAVPTTQTLYSTEAGDKTAISVNDIHQGQLGDCFLLSSFGEEALFHPSAITTMIRDNHNGTETVTLYVDRYGRPPGWYTSTLRPTTVTIDNSFSAYSVNNGATDDVVGNLKEIWPQVLEKACATLGGGLGSIAYGGSPMLALEELTGQQATSLSPASLTPAVFTAKIASGDLIVMDTSSAGWLPYNLVNNHAYMFEKLNGTGSSATVQLHNPWGYDQPNAIPLSRLAQSGIVEINTCHLG